MTALEWAASLREACQYPIQVYHRKLTETVKVMKSSKDPLVVEAVRLINGGRVKEAIEVLDQPVGQQFSDAVISECGKYRYLLNRSWDTTLSTVTFVMLNPSTADDVSDDPTIRRCLGFAKGWGYGRLLVVNLYGYRATNPRELKVKGMTDAKRVGPENDRYLVTAAREASLVVAAWGAGCRVAGSRDRDVLQILKNARSTYSLPVACLGTTVAGFPRHPLYVKADAQLTQYEEVPA